MAEKQASGRAQGLAPLTPERLTAWVETLDVAESHLVSGDSAAAERLAKALFAMLRAAQELHHCLALATPEGEDDAQADGRAFEARIDGLRRAAGLAPIFPDADGERSRGAS